MCLNKIRILGKFKNISKFFFKNIVNPLKSGSCEIHQYNQLITPTYTYLTFPLNLQVDMESDPVSEFIVHCKATHGLHSFA